MDISSIVAGSDVKIVLGSLSIVRSPQSAMIYTLAIDTWSGLTLGVLWDLSASNLF